MADDSSPLNMGAPWAALGGSDVAPVNAGSFVPVGGGQVDPVAQEQFAKLRDIGARLAVQNEMSKAPQPAEETRIKKNKDGSEDVWTKTSRQNYENTIQGAMNYQHALGGYAQRMEQIEQHLAAQEQQARNQPPWVQLATALSANIAQAKNMPGWVQALGKTAADLNPRPDQIAQRRLGVLGEEAQLAEAGARMGETSMQHQQMQEEKTAALAQKTQAEKDHLADRIVQTVRLNAKPGVPPTREEVESLAKVMDRNKVLDKEDMDALYTMSGGMARQAEEGKKAELGRKEDFAKFTSNLAKDRTEDAENLRQKNRVALLHDRFALETSPTKLDFLKKEATFKNELHKELIKANNVLKLNGLEMKTLESVNATQTYVGRTIKMLDDPAFREVSGPLMAYNSDTKQLEFVGEAALPKSWTPVKRAEVAAQLAHEIPRIGELAFPGGISRIASTKMGKELIQSMGANLNQRPDQMQAVLKVVLDANTDRAASVVRAHKGLGWEDEYAGLIGADNPMLDDYWQKNQDAFGHPMNAPSALSKGGAAKPKGKTWDAAKGEWVEGG